MAYVDEILADSPGAYYRMDEASGLIQDASGNANHATSTSGAGSATYEQTGAIESDPSSTAILFNPEFTFSIPDHATLDFADVFTLECWFKFDTAGLASRRILTKQSGAYEMRVNSDNTFSLHRSDVSDTVVSTVAVPDDGQFHHLVATKNGATVKLYLDGTDVTGTVSNSTYADNTSTLQIGGYVTGTHIDGFLDEVALYPTALTQTRVQVHYDAAFTAAAEVVYKRLHGPALLTDAAATLYTVPTGKRARVLSIHASNPTASPVDLTLSIGADAAATRVYDDFEVAADSVESNFDPYDLAAGETIQGFAGTASAMNLTITGYEEDA